LRGASDTPKARKTIEIVRDGLHRIVFETQWKRDEHGWRVRDEAGQVIDLGWGTTAAAWIPLRDFDMEHVLALAEKVEDEGIDKEIWRKVRSFLKQLIDYAELRNDYPRDRANPVTLVPAPAQTGVRLVRRPYLPEIEQIRADFLELKALFQAGVRRARGRSVETPAGVPVPPVVGFGQTSAELVEAIAYGGFRPGEILAVLGRHYAPADLGEQYVHVCQRNVDGQVVRGTKSRRYPDKDVYLLGPLPATMARRVAAAGPDDALFPYPAPIGSGRRASTATGARTTSSRSPAATGSVANQTTRMRSATSTRRCASPRIIRRSTSKARWARDLSERSTGASSGATRARVTEHRCGDRGSAEHGAREAPESAQREVGQGAAAAARLSPRPIPKTCPQTAWLPLGVASG
jgi:hypothetical protein